MSSCCALGRRAITCENMPLPVKGRSSYHAFYTLDLSSDIVALGLSEQIRMGTSEGKHLISAGVVAVENEH